MTDLRHGVSADQHELLDVLDGLEDAGVPIQPLLDVLRQRLTHITQYGHTPAQDAQRSPRSMAISTRDYALDAVDNLIGHPGPAERARARAKLVKSIALGLATLARLDMETSI